jgi:ribosomal protein S18 acetylase RimI-like enzyme
MPAPPTSPELAARGRRWRRAWYETVCDLRPWAYGSVVRSARHPDFWEYNAVIVEREADAAGLLAATDAALADCRHRLIHFDSPIGDELAAALRGEGWRVTRLVWMHHDGRPVGPASAAAERVDYDAVHDLRVAWHEEDFAHVEAEAYWGQAREVAMLAGVQVLAAFDGGRPVGFAQVEAHGGAADVAQVYVLPSYRGRGLGTALTAAATRAAAEMAADVWISADADGRPRRLYERLGFQPAWYAAEAMLAP